MTADSPSAGLLRISSEEELALFSSLPLGSCQQLTVPWRFWGWTLPLLSGMWAGK